jgi:hypothetical protein
MTGSSKAVFLSYASQDADAARNIADALQSAGVEVWFDQSELRGGDAWDRQISNQIRECALFIAVISRRPHSRTHPDLKPTAQGKMPVSGLPKTEVFVSTLSHDWERVPPA